MKATAQHAIFTKELLLRLLWWLCVGVALLAAMPALALNASHYASRSQLADGLWVKIAVYQSGIHQITYRELNRWGFSNPDAVTIFGYGGPCCPKPSRRTMPTT